MLTAGFPRAADVLAAGPPAAAGAPGHYDVVHDNQSLGYGLLGLSGSACRW